MDDIKPYVPKREFRYCMDLTCKPGSGCTKLHIDDLCPNFPKYEPPTSAPETDPRDDYKVDIYVMPEKATYCADITCPGGPYAKCGKKHESDLGINALAS